MILRLHHAPSRLFVSTRVHEPRLTFSSSAISFARRQRQRPAGEQANSEAAQSKEAENENEFDEDEDESADEPALDKLLFAGKEKVNQSGIRSYKDPYAHFRKYVAPSFREPSPRNWLGRDVPFPLNPSFKPPVPLSDELRTRIYRAFMNDPEQNSVRALASRLSISIKRVDAILRLKGMEKAWEKDKPLQTGFTKGMERLLGVSAAQRVELETSELFEDRHIAQGDRPDSSSNGRYDVHEADLQDEAEGNARARQRYQRHFWESVGEGEKAIMPGVLMAQRGDSVPRAKLSGKKTLVERAPGRPTIMFIDVGNAFVDAREKERREREGARRSTLKARKRMQGHA